MLTVRQSRLPSAHPYNGYGRLIALLCGQSPWSFSLSLARLHANFWIRLRQNNYIHSVFREAIQSGSPVTVTLTDNNSRFGSIETAGLVYPCTAYTARHIPRISFSYH